jgi:hypothetical protein
MMTLRALRPAHARQTTEKGTGLFVPLTVALWPEEGKWLSECIEFGIGSFGETPDEAAEEAVDAVCSYLNTIEALGERERVFAEKSITMYLGVPAEVHLPALRRDLAERADLQLRPFEVPIHLLAAAAEHADFQ